MKMLILLVLGVQEARSPVPDPSAQKAAESTAREVFKEEYAKKSLVDRKGLANTLLLQGSKSRDHRKFRYVVFREARDRGAGVGDLETAWTANGYLEREFEIN